MRNLSEVMNEILNEETLEYYTFDIDDNLMFFPTKIHMVHEGNPVDVSTEHFAEIRGKKGWELAKDAFKDFNVSGDAQFIHDAMTAKTGPAWGAFVKCLNNASLFAIITARGHSKEAMKQAVERLIEMNREGINKDMLVKNIRAFASNRPMTDKEAIEFYLKRCGFYPVSNPNVFKEGNAASPEVNKTKALDEFRRNIQQHIAKYKKIRSKVGNKEEVDSTLGFSDDDPKNVTTMNKHVSDTKGKFNKIKSTTVFNTNKNNPGKTKHEL